MKYTEQKIRDEYASLDNSPRSQMRKSELAKMKYCPSDILGLIARSDSGIYFLESVVKNPRLPQDVIEEKLQLIFLGTQTINTTKHILKNPSITTEAFRRANEAGKRLQGRQGDELSYRYFLFGALEHGNCPREIMDYALSSGYLYFWLKLAANPALPQDVIDALLWNQHKEVRLALLRNKKVPVENFLKWIDRPLDEIINGQHTVIQALIKRLPAGEDKDRSITYLKSFNNGVPTRVLVAGIASKEEHLRDIAFDTHPDVRDALLNNEAAPEEYKVISSLNR